MKRALPIVLLAAAALLFCVGVAALGLNAFAARGEPVNLAQWKSPLEQVEAKKLTVANALEPLAGIGDSESIDDALQQGDWDSAFAGLAYMTDLSDADRIGTLLLLASRYAAAKQTAKAAWCYQYAAALAQLSPVPSDLVRAQTLLDAGQGLAKLGLASPARSAVDQAYLVTQYSTAIPHDSRARLFEQSGELYKTFGAALLARQAQQKSAEAASETAGELLAAAHRPYQLATPQLPEDKDLQAAVQARVAAAKELIDQLSLNPPKTEKDLPQELIAALGDKLFSEDGTRQDYYDRELKPDAAPAAQAAVLQDKVRWLALKLRVARGGFGVSLVSEWELQAKTIAAELSEAYDQYFKLSEQEATAAEITADADAQLQDVLRAEVVAGRWGLYQYDDSDLRSRLAELSAKLRDDQVPALRLDSYLRGTEIVYLLVPDELYGQGEKALPK